MSHLQADKPGTLERRVLDAAEAALARQKLVSTIDVLVGLGWLSAGRVDEWRQGRLDCLEQTLTVNPAKLTTALRLFHDWARRRGLHPSETDYIARTRDRRSLRFSESGDSELERTYRTHWLSAELPESARKRLQERQSHAPDLVVISPLKKWACTACGGTGDLLLMEGPGPLCMRCADLDHLVFLPSGQATLTRRARKASPLSAVVVRFSRARQRYERQGILVEEAALDAVERECLADGEARARRRERDEERRAGEDLVLQAEMAREIELLFPGCPAERAQAIASHTAVRGSGRVGRTAAGRALDPEAVTLAVAASVRHLDTGYDELLMSGLDRAEARARVRPEVERILERWQSDSSPAVRRARKLG